MYYILYNIKKDVGGKGMDDVASIGLPYTWKNMVGKKIMK
jgi:hypothetical protein